MRRRRQLFGVFRNCLTDTFVSHDPSQTIWNPRQSLQWRATPPSRVNASSDFAGSCFDEDKVSMRTSEGLHVESLKLISDNVMQPSLSTSGPSLGLEDCEAGALIVNSKCLNSHADLVPLPRNASRMCERPGAEPRPKTEIGHARSGVCSSRGSPSVTKFQTRDPNPNRSGQFRKSSQA